MNCEEKCSKDDLVINQKETGVWIHGAAQLQVTVRNQCSSCSQSQVKLTCDGFQSLEGLDPKTLVKSGDVCLLFNGSSIAQYSEINFTYAWQDPYPFKAVSSVINCD